MLDCSSAGRYGLFEAMEMNAPSNWKAYIDLAHPVWRPYRGLLDRMPAGAFPAADCLNGLLPPGARSGGGKPLTFVPATEIPGVEYETHIFETGQVSTRENNWHDLLNALVWCRLPRLKAAMNAMHYSHLDEAHAGRRGPLRDALTLLDESGAVLLASDREALQTLAERDWSSAFEGCGKAWGHTVVTVVCGHGLLEKFLQPYKSMTAHCLLCHCGSTESIRLAGDSLGTVDADLARLLSGDGRLTGPDMLSPLPLMGIPGWWPPGTQDRTFYEDETVFRPAPRGSRPVPVHSL